jgi:hypothetical protein
MAVGNNLNMNGAAYWRAPFFVRKTTAVFAAGSGAQHEGKNIRRQEKESVVTNVPLTPINYIFLLIAIQA